jgi:hypothetical protein
MSQTVAARGEGWIGDETARREFPPLRAAWAKRGRQQQVVISGRNAQRVIWAAVNVVPGACVRVGRPRARKEDAQAFVATLGQVRPDGAKLLVWDNAPPRPAPPPHLGAPGGGGGRHHAHLSAVPRTRAQPL